MLLQIRIFGFNLNIKVYKIRRSYSKHTATTAGSLKIHVESKHEGVRYPCNQCEYAATQPGVLKIHIENIHEGVRYPCGQCKFVATQSCHLKTHQKRKHNNQVLYIVNFKLSSIVCEHFFFVKCKNIAK